MKVYVQDADGAEVELVVVEPDPKDGSFCASLPIGSLVVVLAKDAWIRICPND